MNLKRRQFSQFLLAAGSTLAFKTLKINNYLSPNQNSLLLQSLSGDFGFLQDIGSPCRDKQILNGTMVVDPLTQQEWFVLTNMNEISKMEIIFVDYTNNSGQVFHCPAGSGAWAIKKVGVNKLVIGTFYDGQFIVFDIHTRKFITTVDVPGETYIWNLALGSDGRIYGGTYPGAKLVALDLNNYTVEDCGAPVLPNLYLRFVSETPDGRILCSFRTQNTTTRLYNPSTKEFELVPKQLEKIHRGVSWNGYFLAQSKVFIGQSLKLLQDFPFPTPPANNGAWHVDLDLTTENLLVLKQGNALYRYAGETPH